MSDETDDYTVGYGKPPRHSQFQAGRSGNPKGRPRGSKNLATIFSKIINEKVQVKGPSGMKSITKFEAGLTQLANMAATGDKRAIRDLMQWVALLGTWSPLFHRPLFMCILLRQRMGDLIQFNAIRFPSGVLIKS